MAGFLADLYAFDGNNCVNGPTPFTDLQVFDAVRAEIACIYDLGLTYGTSPTTYSPNDVVNRRQMAVFLTRLWRVLDNDCPVGGDPFVDVDPRLPYADEVACMYQIGVVRGTTETTFSPNEPVTRAQMAVLVARFGRLVQE